ncbi:MAG: hypothetical protein QXJ63_01265 [Candidatus Bathyarchaeia archaeon]
MFNGLPWKLQRVKRSYFKERFKQQQRLKEEVARLDTLLRENAIDEDTYRRLRKLLEIGYQQQRQETRRKYGFQ